MSGNDMNENDPMDRNDTVNENNSAPEDDSFKDDELMQRASEPPEFPAATPERIERTWRAIEDHVEAQKVVAFPAVPLWSRQLFKVAALLVVGFGVAWFAAERSWLPLTSPTQVATLPDDPVSADPDRSWLAGSNYGDRLEALLLGVSRGGSGGISEVAPVAREVSRELLTDNRFYQRVARRHDDPELSDLLARIEIVLLAVATAPEGQEQEAVNALREFLDETDLIDEIRDLRSSVPKMPMARLTSGS